MIIYEYITSTTPNYVNHLHVYMVQNAISTLGGVQNVSMLVNS